MTPSARSVQWFKNRGYIVARVEQRLHIPGSPWPRTKDAFGFGDLLVALENFGVALIQVTSTGNLNAREKKSRELPELREWLKSGGRFILHGWAKRGARGKRKKWTLAEREIVL